MRMAHPTASPRQSPDLRLLLGRLLTAIGLLKGRLTVTTLETILAHLEQLGYSPTPVGSLTAPHATDPYYVIAVGSANNRHMLIVRAGQDANFRYYVPLSGNNNNDQLQALADWLEANVGPANEDEE
jgi:hypothetical protein